MKTIPIGMTNPDMRRDENSAEYVRRKGWGVGTHLIGDEGYGPREIIITAVGEHSILARELDGGREQTWTLWMRPWQPVTPDIPEPTPIYNALVEELEVMKEVRRNNEEANLATLVEAGLR